MPAHPTSPRPSRDYSVLVVDDDGLMRSLVARTLKNAGYTVWTAANAAEARRILGSVERLDVLLTDVAMPGGLGPEVAAEARQTHPYARLAYMSSHSIVHLHDKGVDLGPASFLDKPFMPEELLTFMTSVVGGQRQPARR